MIEIGKHEGIVGIAISGGLDSTVILYHLLEAGNKVSSYTMRWGDDNKESVVAEKIARFYGIQHTIIDFTPNRYWQTLDLCMKFYDKPRWMVWPHMILEEAKRVGKIIFYNGEGCDEIFGIIRIDVILRDGQI